MKPGAFENVSPPFYILIGGIIKKRDVSIQTNDGTTNRLIDRCLNTSEQYFSYIDYEKKLTFVNMYKVKKNVYHAY